MSKSKLRSSGKRRRRVFANGAVNCSTCPVFKTMLKSIRYNSQDRLHYSRSKIIECTLSEHSIVMNKTRIL